MFSIQNLEFSQGGKGILSPRSLSLRSGNHLLLLGPSGCGKTTLMNLMAGLLKPSAGEIVFQDRVYSSLSESDLDRLRAENFGFVFQKLHLIGHLSVEQNISIAQPQKDTASIKNLIADLGLSGKDQQKARDLSVGEAQRVAIARALANNPKVIFADEPTSALDDENTLKVMDMLFEQTQKTGVSLIVATHDGRIKGRFSDILEMIA
jgi:putative ABC transport system ATP-binding protein